MKKHRGFSYEEKKINRMNRRELAEYLFLRKWEEGTIWLKVHDEFKKDLPGGKIRYFQKALQAMDKQALSRNEEVTKMVNSVFDLRRSFDELEMKLCEALQIWLYTSLLIAKNLQRKGSRQTKALEDRCLGEALNLWTTNWSKLMDDETLNILMHNLKDKK